MTVHRKKLIEITPPMGAINAASRGELAYRIHKIYEQKMRAAEALCYNGRVRSWPEIARPVQAEGESSPAQEAPF